MLQTFQHGSEPRRWLLKSPGHLQTLAQVFAEYPDAKVIHTHRDPRRFIASLVSLLAVLRFTRSDQVDVATLGPLMELTYQMFLEQVIDQRENGTIPNDRIVDSHFLDLMADPVASLRRLYDELELPWPANHDRTVRDYLAAKPKGSTASTATRSPMSASTKPRSAPRSAATSTTTASPKSGSQYPGRRTARSRGSRTRHLAVKTKSAATALPATARRARRVTAVGRALEL